jgi:lipoprotein-anchoring transpeptidase ErfK/SrfK
LACAILAGTALAAVAADSVPSAPAEPAPRIESTLDLQVELHRHGFSCGSIDGVAGAQTVEALKAFQRGADLDETGEADEETSKLLRTGDPTLTKYTFTGAELGGVHPVPGTWLEKSQLTALGYGTPLEMVAERFHSNPSLIRSLNPGVNWDAVLPGMTVTVPAAVPVVISGSAARIIISLSDHELEVFEAQGKVIAHFPVSIARMAEKRPVGALQVVVVVPNPNYTFDPDLFPESAEGRELGRKLVLPPGPNRSEDVGRTESHGCFRLANWDAQTLMGLVQVGMTVDVM